MIEQLIKDNPRFHEYKGSLTSWSVHADTLRFLYQMLEPGMATLETGCGQTTVVFAIAQTRHNCITPSTEEVTRIRAYCRDVNLPEHINFISESSEIALPCWNSSPWELDVVFIDGAHRFPLPIIDWYYTSRRLKSGGLVAVDDYTMPSVRILYDFLCLEEEWEEVCIVQNTAFFRKLRDAYIDFEDDWQHQKINLKFKKSFDGKAGPLRVKRNAATSLKAFLKRIAGK